MTDTSSLTRPLIILTGDLGSGKTSGLPLLAERLGSQKPYFIVNEVGAADRYVGAFGVPTDRLSLLPGGCICCEKKDELVELLVSLVEHTQSEFDSIVLESSGLANPAAILRFISLHPKLNHQLKVSSLVYFLDAGSGRPSGPLRPEDLTSLAVADVCVLSKTDMISTVDRGVLLAAVANANPTVAIFEQKREIDIMVSRIKNPDVTDLTVIQQRENPAKGQLAPSAVPDHTKVDVLNFSMPFGTSWLALSTWLMALLQEKDRGILRAKAAIANSSGWISINGVGSTVFPAVGLELAHGEERPCGTLVLIGFGLSEIHIVRSLRAFVSENITVTSLRINKEF